MKPNRKANKVSEFLDYLTEAVDAYNESSEEEPVSVDAFVRRYLADTFYVPLATGTFFTGDMEDVEASAEELAKYRKTLEIFRKEYDERLAQLPEDKRGNLEHIRKPRSVEDKTVSVSAFD